MREGEREGGALALWMIERHRNRERERTWEQERRAGLRFHPTKTLSGRREGDDGEDGAGGESRGRNKRARSERWRNLREETSGEPAGVPFVLRQVAGFSCCVRVFACILCG